MRIDSIRVANKTDADEVATLVNTSYRPISGARGWTHESDLVSGDRTNPGQVADATAREDSAILLGLIGDKVVACIHVEKEGDNCRIGMLAVSPRLQGSGVGTEMLHRAERYAKLNYGSAEFVMLVVSARSELISFYLRRGYRKTGVAMDYPLSAGAGIPKHTGLEVEVLRKLSSNLVDSDGLPVGCAPE